jgi:hypothetical protein
MIMNQDEQHLKLLATFHYIVGGLIALFSCFPVIHLVLGIVMIVAPEKMDSSGQPPPALIGWIFALIGGSIIVIGWMLAGCVVAAGRCLAKRRHYMFCLVMAGIQCIYMPFGTVLGVFTIIVLMRNSVKEAFTAKTLEASVAGAPQPQG